MLHCAGRIRGFRIGHCRCGYDAELGNASFPGGKHSISGTGALLGADQAARAEVGPSCGGAVHADDRPGLGVSIRPLRAVIFAIYSK